SGPIGISIAPGLDDRVLEGVVVERIGDLALVADRAPQRERLRVRDGHRRDVGLPPGDPAEGLHQAGAEPRILSRPGSVRDRLDPPPRFGEMSALLPIAPHREREPDRGVGVTRDRGPIEDRADVVVLALEAAEPATLIVAR